MPVLQFRHGLFSNRAVYSRARWSAVAAVLVACYPREPWCWWGLGLVLLYFLAVGIIPWATRVCLGPEEVRLVRFGRTIQNIPVHQLKLICVVGSSSDDLLLLSGASEAELGSDGRALYRLLSRSPWRSHRRDLIYFPMNQVAAAAIRCCYPQVPYRNWEQRPDTGNGNLVPFSDGYRLEPQPDGIWLEKKGQRTLHLPSAEIKTIARIDWYNPGKFYQHHKIFFVASTQTVEELAANARPLPPGMAELPIAQELRAVTRLSADYVWWTPRKKTFLPIYDRPGRREELQRLYPLARWVDLHAGQFGDVNVNTLKA